MLLQGYWQEICLKVWLLTKISCPRVWLLGVLGIKMVITLLVLCIMIKMFFVFFLLFVLGCLKIIRNTHGQIQYLLDYSPGTILCLCISFVSLFICLTFIIHMLLSWNIWTFWDWTPTDITSMWDTINLKFSHLSRILLFSKNF